MTTRCHALYICHEMPHALLYLIDPYQHRDSRSVFVKHVISWCCPKFLNKTWSTSSSLSTERSNILFHFHHPAFLLVYNRYWYRCPYSIPTSLHQHFQGNISAFEKSALIYNNKISPIVLSVQRILTYQFHLYHGKGMLRASDHFLLDSRVIVFNHFIKCLRGCFVTELNQNVNDAIYEVAQVAKTITIP